MSRLSSRLSPRLSFRLPLRLLPLSAALLAGCIVHVESRTPAAKTAMAPAAVTTSTAALTPTPTATPTTAATRTEPALDPDTGDTGQPLSENMRSFDVLTYALDIEVFPEQKRIAGNGRAELQVLKDITHVELRLDARFAISRMTVNGAQTTHTRKQGVLHIALPVPAKAGEKLSVQVHYDGHPHVAKRAPWDGGSVWAKTPDGKPWVATAVQGEGCDLWWPCKDHFADKPNQVDMRITVPAGLVAAMNGRLLKQETQPDGRETFVWRMVSPASDYNIALNVGPYVAVRETYTSINGEFVPIEFWALPENAEKARTMVNEDLRKQVAWFEKMFGPYPWGKDKLGFVETSHLGMEHQSINAYGKGYKRDENGFDWLLHHELSHEWFGNLMTHETLNDAWLHEGFGQYAQPLYAQYLYGDMAYSQFMYRLYLRLKNCTPIVPGGNPTANDAFQSDIYDKGSWTLHTLRHLIGDEAFYKATRILLYGTDQTAKIPYPIAPRYRNTNEFIAIVNKLTGKDWNWLFDVYLREAKLPELIAERGDKRLSLHWQVPGNRPFPMPVQVEVNGKRRTVSFEQGRASVAVKPTDHVRIDPDMKVLRMLPMIGECATKPAG